MQDEDAVLAIDIEITRGDFAMACNIRIAAGCTGIFGPSGAGKSTLLEVINGNMNPDRGSIRLGKEILADTHRGFFRPAHERHVGWVPQDALLFPHLKVIDNLLFGHRRRKTLSYSGPSPHHVIGVLGLDRLLARWPSDLSGGEKQRVSLGRALLSNARILLLDEPLASLDTARRSEILDLLDEVKYEFKIPILYVTHSFAEVMRLADHLILLDAGKVQASGAIDSLMGRLDTPMLSNRTDVGSLLRLDDLTLLENQPAVGMLEGQALVLPWSASEWRLPARALPLRVYVPADEVILALEPPRMLSIRNTLLCQIERMLQKSPQTMLIELAIGKQKLLASITVAAAEQLNLQVGLPVYALIKSMSLDAPAGRKLLWDSEHL